MKCYIILSAVFGIVITIVSYCTTMGIAYWMHGMPPTDEYLNIIAANDPKLTKKLKHI